jgi:hypothetical protein
MNAKIGLSDSAPKIKLYQAGLISPYSQHQN